MKNPNCPKCGKKMHKGAIAQSGKIRWRCEKIVDGVRTICLNTTNPAKPQGKRFEPEKKLYFDQPLKKKKVIVTWAQNATPAHEGFWNSLNVLANDIDGQIMVENGRYKNPTSTWEGSQKNQQWWDPRFEGKLVNKRVELGSNLVLLADIHTQPTAVRPLSGFESITHSESGILPHPKFQLECIPTLVGKLPKIMTTTGACTVENYTDTKAGKKGDFHHVIGAAVVELDGSDFHVHQINARSDGSFCHLGKTYHPDGSIRNAGAYRGLVYGDAHPLFADPAVVAATWGVGGLVELLNPDVEIFHDLMDSYAVNPHHEHNPFIAIAKRDSQKDDVRQEVDYTINWLKTIVGERKAVIVPSNHDNMLARYIRNKDWREDPTNALFYLETAYHMALSTVMTPTGVWTHDPFHYWLSKRGFGNIRCLPSNHPYAIEGIELSLHGHEGPNGARGSRQNLSKIGAKTIIGHSHSPGATEGCWQTGTKTYLGLEYTGPVGSWHNADISIDPFGKRHFHFFVNGKFRA